MGKSASDERGFSLLELLVAMTITLIVSGAIYGLLSGGQNAFRREPELTERQQNIRTSMDLIMRDIANAGVGLPPFVQVFKEGLDACAACPVAPLTNVRTDELEIISSGGRDAEPVCSDPGNSSQNIILVRAGVVFPVGSVIVLTTTDGRWTTRYVTGTGTTNLGADNCVAGQDHTIVNFNQGAGDPSGLNVAGGPCRTTLPGFGNIDAPPCTINSMTFSEIVRYRIRNDADGVPVLQRFTSARWNDGFQTIARGIEDLQAQYAQAGTPDTWVDDAPLVTPPAPPTAPAPVAYGTLISHVRVTLSARSEARNLQGAQSAAVGPARARGSLTSTGSPRTALIHVVRGRPGSPAPSPGSWYWE